jgi:hypothetical protein
MTKTSIILFILYFLISGCEGKSKENTIKADTGQEIVEVSAEFAEFYERFHLDSAYQMAHIVFPLEGIPVIRDTIPENLEDFKWTKANWIIHRPFDLTDGSFSRNMYQYGDKLIVEKIEARQMGFGMERRFAKLQGEWFLIYYAAMNRM